jgi:hypothetical protein
MTARALRSDFKVERNSKIKRLVIEGRYSLAQIGTMFPSIEGKPLSRQRIHQIAFGKKSRSRSTCSFVTR